MPPRSTYVFIIGLGFTIAILVGLWLALQVSAGNNLLDLLGIALIGFIPSALLTSYGAYHYTHADQEPESVDNIDVWHQREIIDILHQNHAISISEIAKQLDIEETDVKDSIIQLLELGIFTGSVDWENNMLYSQKTQQLS